MSISSSRTRPCSVRAAEREEGLAHLPDFFGRVGPRQDIVPEVVPRCEFLDPGNQAL